MDIGSLGNHFAGTTKLDLRGRSFFATMLCFALLIGLAWYGNGEKSNFALLLAAYYAALGAIVYFKWKPLWEFLGRVEDEFEEHKQGEG